ncbi:MarR family winged helix-turn-helix transcriptional regulator [Novosphingobium sp. AP12]|uniref:MarR family winged helix-turn-helix transcriptional regulator n=1 Tax=Novosphingobium sp. AP12 TaxID=1144305 RepID=UPI0002F3FD5C|nr:MarR family winged helix-turn-helix transcriptional regulator [Novosphingobium sp. AP12]
MHHDSIEGPCACTALRKAARAVSRVYDDALSGRGISTAQFAILRHVGRGEPVALSPLADQLAMDRTTLYRGLAPLEAKGWVAVEQGPGKARLASLTPAGRAAMNEAEDDWHEVQARIIAALGAEQWATLQSTLRAVTEIARQEIH